ncbi:S8 family serine peptidase [Allosaccharopolyspora coralli]|uniref:S8 family serine peptidase n=1 Tax=Allosaccharopolyspora coralli TaxID=2665642 RepID=A0A5Q3QA70_9PSEU|nr:S8 family serine peptidase [Allosaccharopolyspora coralli]QGK70084.1 S8 family serine peptidase [Allosaccharopolyspora coralli]
MTGPGQDIGRYLVLFDDDAEQDGIDELTRLTGIRAASTRDAGGASVAEMFASSDGVVLHELGLAMINAGPDQARSLTDVALAGGPIAAFEPDRTVYALAAEPAPDPGAGQLTWGLRAVGADQSDATGTGVRVAVLDTGFDAGHPDFAGREVVTASFVDGEDAQDGHGHGTHCIGTACGPRDPAAGGPGYGVATGAAIYAGKVLGNEGSGTDSGILEGIQWAITQQCPVVSMSLGAATQPGQPFSQAFERVAARAMARGTLIVAAAGNESSRDAGSIAPVGHPANCPSIMAIAAVDESGGVADFSSGTVDRIGQVDLAAPGVDVHSSWPGGGHRTLSGTSMATPHVAGVAALVAERHQARAWGLWARLAQSSHRMPLPSTDVGGGMVFAP